MQGSSPYLPVNNARRGPSLNETKVLLDYSAGTVFSRFIGAPDTDAMAPDRILVAGLAAPDDLVFFLRMGAE